MLEKLSTSRVNSTVTIIIAIALALALSFLGLAQLGQADHAPALSAVPAVMSFSARSRVTMTDSARWTMMAGEALNLYGSTAWVITEPAPRMAQVESTRLNGIAATLYNPYGTTVIVRAGLSPSQQIESARLDGIASAYINPHGSTAWVHAGHKTILTTESHRLTRLAGSYFNLYGTSLTR